MVGWGQVEWDLHLWVKAPQGTLRSQHAPVEKLCLQQRGCPCTHHPKQRVSPITQEGKQGSGHPTKASLSP